MAFKTCDEALTVSHIFVNSIEFMDIRFQCFSVAGLKELFNDETDDLILNFIRKIGLHYSIYEDINIY